MLLCIVWIILKNYLSVVTVKVKLTTLQTVASSPSIRASLLTYRYLILTHL